MSDTRPPMRTRRARPPGFGAQSNQDVAPPESRSERQPRAPNAKVPTTPSAPPQIAPPHEQLPDLHDARTRPVFVRAPDPLGRWLELTLVALREHRPKATRQDIICALMLRYVRNDPADADHLIGLLDDLERARARR